MVYIYICFRNKKEHNKNNVRTMEKVLQNREKKIQYKRKVKVANKHKN